ncbi:GNAT family N-acetyltransferase [Nocardia lijiangensis]|uniref:GNAT family N-acetyltransferase n=1 Tax=Nocardia lijiangensis TaxID=299618 RepID=UPI00083128EE|nr:GNAT family N-acetyltransferase [Nocardia lijiangensis]
MSIHHDNTSRAPARQNADRWPADLAARPIVRRAEDDDELIGFHDLAVLAGVSDPNLLVRQLLTHSHDQILGASLDGTDPGRVIHALHNDGLPATVARRTMALAAVVDGQLVGGLVAGPSVQTLLQPAVQGRRDTLTAALLRTIEIQIVAVNAEHRHLGVGTALVRAAIDQARRANAHLVHGQFDTERTNLASFFRGCGFSVDLPTAGLDFATLADIDLQLTTTPEQRYFSLTF